MTCAAAVDVAIGALTAVTGYRQFLSDPRGIAHEQKIVDRLWQKAREDWEREPTAIISHGAVFSRIVTNEILCQACAYWTFNPTSPLPSFELRLIAIDKTKKHRLDVLVRPRGENKRHPGNRTIRRSLKAYTFGRLYIADELEKKWVTDAVAMLLIYLAQKKLLDFDAGPDSKQWILRYLEENYWDTQKVGAISLLGELLKNWIIPEDYRAFRKYVANTAYGLSKMDNFSSPSISDSAREEIPVIEAAKLLGYSKRRLYELRKDQPPGHKALRPEDIQSLEARKKPRIYGKVSHAD